MLASAQKRNDEAGETQKEQATRHAMEAGSAFTKWAVRDPSQPLQLFANRPGSGLANALRDGGGSGAMTDCTQLHVPRRCLPRQEQLAEAKAQKLKDRQPAQPAPRMTRRLCLRSWKERLVTELQAADEAGSKQLLGTFFRTFLCAIV